MTLAELAALAAKMEGFKRPTRKCEWCGGVKWGNRLGPCDKCDDSGRTFDDSPAALLMAVHVCIAGRDLSADIDGTTVVVRRPKSSGIETARDTTPESIARAALVALLRAHGVEVAGD